MRLQGRFALAIVLLVLTSAAASGQRYDVLYSFCSASNCADGKTPESGLIRDASGNLYGTTTYGGENGQGTLFKVDSGSETVLYSFCSVPISGVCTDGAEPVSGVILVGNDLYGTTYVGGTYGKGTIFKWDNNAQAETVLYSFGAFAGDGANPTGGLIQDASGNLYGTTYYGGTATVGTVFEFDPSKQQETVLYSFCSVPISGVCTDGAYPYAGVIWDATSGNLYGTTQWGGNGSGTVFQLNIKQDSEKVLYSFCSILIDGICYDGQHPDGNLLLDAGNLYGTTSAGGAPFNASGTLFELVNNSNNNWALTTLHSFCSVVDSAGFCTDGAQPVAGLISDAQGKNLYGTTQFGGRNPGPNGDAGGTVFKWNKTTGEEVLYNFCSSSSCTDGANPYGELVLDGSGNLYGTTTAEGAHGGGVVFEIEEATAMPPAFQFVPVTPCRVADTRNAYGPFGGPEMSAGKPRSFDIPQSACGIPSTAAAYSLNVTVVPNGPLDYLTIWPTGETQPVVSTLNSDGRIKANAAIVPAGTDGGVNVYVSDSTQVILDIDGYFVSAGTTSALAFYPLTPCRVVDTRNSTGLLGGPSIAGGTSRAFSILSGTCGIPTSAKAYSLNVTAVPYNTLNYLTIWPTGENKPYVSTLNAPTGAITANAAIVPAGTSGQVSVYVSATSDVILDVNGYFAPPGSGGLSLYTVTPCRVIDTRQLSSPPFPPLPPLKYFPVNVEGSSCAPASTAQAYVLNATVVPNGPFPYLTLWPDGESQPERLNLERRRRSHYFEHGHRSDEQWSRRRLFGRIWKSHR